MADANLRNLLPQGDHNGLASIAGDLIKDPRRLRVMLVLIDCVKVTHKTDDGADIATARIRRIEPLLSEDLPAAEQLIRRALEARCGLTTLPLDLENELRDAFADFDPEADEDTQPGEDGEGGEGEAPPEPPEPGDDEPPRGGRGRRR